MVAGKRISCGLRTVSNLAVEACKWGKKGEHFASGESRRMTWWGGGIGNWLVGTETQVPAIRGDRSFAGEGLGQDRGGYFL